MFDLIEEPKEPSPNPTESLPEWPIEKRLADEKELLGFYVSGHPLAPFQSILNRYCLSNSETIRKLENRAMTRIGGMVSAVKQGSSSKTGKPYAILTIEDMVGTFQTLCMNENFDRNQHLFQANLPILVVGEVNNAEDKTKVFPQEIMPLEEAPQRLTIQVHLRLKHETTLRPLLPQIRQLAENHKGQCPLFLCFQNHKGDPVIIETHKQYYVQPSLKLETEVHQLLGEDSYHVRTEKSPRRSHASAQPTTKTTRRPSR